MQSNNFKKIVWFVNSYCPVNCTSCNVRCAGKPHSTLPVSTIESMLRTINSIPGIPRYLVWTGGEPFLSGEFMVEAIEHAGRIGFISEILTSGCWYETQPDLAVKLRKAGPFGVRISLDSEHQKSVSLELIVNLVHHLTGLQIPVSFTIRDIPGAPPGSQFFLEFIQKNLTGLWNQNRSTSRFIHIIPTIPLELRIQDMASSVSRRKKMTCSMKFSDFVIGEDGFLYPCCGLVGTKNQTKYRIADLTKIQPDKLWTSFVNHPFVSTIQEHSAEAICRIMGLLPETQSTPSPIPACFYCRIIADTVGPDEISMCRGRSVR